MFTGIFLELFFVSIISTFLNEESLQDIKHFIYKSLLASAKMFGIIKIEHSQMIFMFIKLIKI